MIIEGLIAVLFIFIAVLAYMLCKQKKRIKSLEFGYEVLNAHGKTAQTCINAANEKIVDHNKKLKNLGQG